MERRENNKPFKRMKADCLSSVIFGVEIDFGFEEHVCVSFAGQGLDRISRSLQDRRLNRLVRGKYGRAGDHGVHDHRKYCDNTLVRSLGIPIAVL